MIELSITPSIVKQHKDWIFGENAQDDDRLYKKLNFLVDNEVVPDIKNVFKFIFDNLSSIISGDLESLDSIINRYEAIMKDFRNTDLKEKSKVRGRNIYQGAKERKLIKQLKEVFVNEYEYFYSSKNWNAYIFLKELGVSICPYCNSQFLFLYNEKGRKTRATLDHFFDKATYPFLAISIYNLVPSCKVCNSDLKSTKLFHLGKNYSPYERNIVENMRFKIDVTSVKKSSKLINEYSEIDYYEMFIGNSTEFKIDIEINTEDEMKKLKIKGNLEVFRIVDLYNKYHKNYVKSLIRKSHIYNKVYLYSLMNTFESIFLNEEDLYNAIYPKITDDKNYMLAKLSREIAKQQLEFLNSHN
ncbi:hypothetical protein [Lysinibacillus sp. NPDC086135]|uniref:hypothetical protein n=1 Tax=Lysinibacillus sp. NPDC086135 TaxID=3364130 RepID=UPI0038093AEE